MLFHQTAKVNMAKLAQPQCDHCPSLRTSLTVLITLWLQLQISKIVQVRTLKRTSFLFSLATLCGLVEVCFFSPKVFLANLVL